MVKQQTTSHARGLRAEDYAAAYLENKKYKIIARRYKTKFGEIDLIAQHKNTLCFVEVKIRKNQSEALESITTRAQKRIEQTALFFLAQNQEYEKMDMRFDVIALTSPFDILHLDNAWQACS